MSRTRRTILLFLVVAIAIAVLAPSAAFAWVTQDPWGVAPSPAGGGGGGSTAYWPWGLGYVTHQSGATWGSGASDTYNMFNTTGTTYISTLNSSGGSQQFLAWQNQNPAGVAPYLKLTNNNSATTVPMTFGTPNRDKNGVRLQAPPSYVAPGGDVFTSSAGNAWWVPWTAALAPGTSYTFVYQRGGSTNDGLTGAIETSGSVQRGYINTGASLSGGAPYVVYGDEQGQYNAQLYDTFQFRNPNTGVYSSFTFTFQTYADTSVFESALATAQSALTTATANSGTGPGQVDPARVAVLDSVVTSAAAVPLATMSQRLQPDVDAAVSALQAAVAQAQVLNPFPPVTSILGIPAGWATGTVTFSLVATGNAPPFVTSYALNGGLPAIYSSPVGVSAEGTTVVSYFSTDALSVREATNTATIRIDSVAPVTSIHGVVEDGLYPGLALFTFSAADAGSGVASTRYSIDGGADLAYTGSLLGVSGAGEHSVTFHSADVAGNTEAAQTVEFSVSAGPPVTTISGVSASWVNTSAPVFSLTATGDAPPITTHYALNGGSDSVYSSPVTVSAQGTTTVSYRSVDSIGQAETTKTATVRYDNVKPVSSLSGVTSGGTYSAPVTLQLSATDNASGIQKIQYVLDSVQPTSTFTTPLTVSSVGAHSIVYWAMDNASNKESPAHAATFTVSAGAPVTTISGVSASWVNTAAPVFSLDATGDAPPITTHYSLNGGSGTVYASPVTVSTQGTTTVAYWSVDSIGQTESTKTAQVRYDNAQPVSSLTGAAPGGIYASPVALRLSATDNASGVQKIQYVLDSVQPTSTFTTTLTVSTPGAHSIVYWAMDNASNKEVPAHTATFTVSAGAPVTTVSGIPAGWATATATVSLAASGDAPPIKSYYALGAGAVTTYTAPVPVSTQGTTTLSYFSVDSLGQKETTKTATIRVDTIAPSTISDVLVFYLNSATIHLSATDTASGVAHTYFRLDGGVQTEGLTVAVAGIGVHAIEFWSADAAGNTETPHKSATFTVTDALAPTTTSDAVATYVDSATIHLTATDNVGGSGVEHTYYRLDGGAQTAGTTIVATGPGSHTLEFWSVDVVANEELPHHTATFTITSSDVTAPSTTSDALASYIGTATVHLSATDNVGGSGVAHTYHRLDGGAQTEGTTIVIPGVGAHNLEFWSVDAIGNVETPHHTVGFTIAAPAKTPTTITIGRTPASVVAPKPFVLQGVLTPGTIGDPCVVYVKKPGSGRWSYSSARLAYVATGAGARWWYRYTPVMRGVHTFYVAFAGDATRLGSRSINITESVR